MIVIEKPYKYKLIIFFLYFGIQSQFLAAQDQSNGSVNSAENKADTIYGLNQLLYNGKQYTFYKSETILGDQFLINDNYLEGDLVIKGIHFSGLSVNLDIYNQQLLLKYEDINRSVKIIVVSKAWLEGFTLKVNESKQTFTSATQINQIVESSLNEMDFKLISSPEFPQRFYQVIGNDSIKILFFWKKDLLLSNAIGKASYAFSAAAKEQFLKIGDQIVRYKNNRSFTSIFDPTKQGMIRKYLKEHKINLKKASDKAIFDLITFCNNI